MTKTYQRSQAAIRKIANAFEEILQEVEEGDDETVAMIRFEESVHTALAARGWFIFDYEEDPSEYHSEWEASRTEPDHDNEIYYEKTSVDPDDGCVFVEFAGPSDGPFTGAKYQTLEHLLMDVSTIEAFRHGDVLPELPNAQKVVLNASNPSQIRTA